MEKQLIASLRSHFKSGISIYDLLKVEFDSDNNVIEVSVEYNENINGKQFTRVDKSETFKASPAHVYMIAASINKFLVDKDFLFKKYSNLDMIEWVWLGKSELISIEAKLAASMQRLGVE